MGLAILVDRKVLPIEDSIEWGKWIESNWETSARLVAYSIFPEGKISTVFLGINHGFSGNSLWFETMIFGGEHDEYQKRYETWEEAEQGHIDAFNLVMKKGLSKEP